VRGLSRPARCRPRRAPQTYPGGCDPRQRRNAGEFSRSSELFSKSKPGLSALIMVSARRRTSAYWRVVLRFEIAATCPLVGRIFIRRALSRCATINLWSAQAGAIPGRGPTASGGPPSQCAPALARSGSDWEKNFLGASNCPSASVAGWPRLNHQPMLLLNALAGHQTQSPEQHWKPGWYRNIVV